MQPVAENIKLGIICPLVITSTDRTSLVSGVPTFSEAGIPGFAALSWWGVYLLAGTPKDIQDKYHAALVKIMSEPEIKERFAALGVQAQATSMDEFKSFLSSENSKYSKLITENKIMAE